MNRVMYLPRILLKENGKIIGIKDYRVNEILDIPEEFPDSRIEELHKEWLFEFTMGLEPEEIFHSKDLFYKDVDKLNGLIYEQTFYKNKGLDRFSMGVKNDIEICYTLIDDAYRIDHRPLIEEIEKVYSEIFINKRAERLEKFSNWLSYYFNFRCSLNATHNGIVLNREKAQLIMDELNKWIRKEQESLIIKESKGNVPEEIIEEGVNLIKNEGIGRSEAARRMVAEYYPELDEDSKNNRTNTIRVRIGTLYTKSHNNKK